jgi:hypothetical protein
LKRNGWVGRKVSSISGDGENGEGVVAANLDTVDTRPKLRVRLAMRNPNTVLAPEATP